MYNKMQQQLATGTTRDYLCLVGLSSGCGLCGFRNDRERRTEMTAEHLQCLTAPNSTSVEDGMDQKNRKKNQQYLITTKTV